MSLIGSDQLWVFTTVEVDSPMVQVDGFPVLIRSRFKVVPGTE